MKNPGKVIPYGQMKGVKAMADKKEVKLGDMLDICLELRGWNDCGGGSYEVKSQTIDAITTKLNNLFVRSAWPDTELVEALEAICGTTCVDGYGKVIEIADKALGKYRRKNNE